MGRQLQVLLILGMVGFAEAEPPGRVFYIRQTVGDDTNDGLSPGNAWRSISKLSGAMRAGDTAYVGPGLYRDQILVGSDGTAQKPIRFIADTTGVHSGDPAGVVMTPMSTDRWATISGMRSASSISSPDGVSLPMLLEFESRTPTTRKLPLEKPE